MYCEIALKNNFSVALAQAANPLKEFFKEGTGIWLPANSEFSVGAVWQNNFGETSDL
ncbi:MAG TPA: hypothetical protein VNS50_06745 [Ginsengibacter sp.]|nr:hypothetical protein [Ginsengibacter sp.]